MAASAFTVFSAFTEKSSNNQENWQDASTALQDLDKGGADLNSILHYSWFNIPMFFIIHKV
jgi:hypothetical protein